jgi:phage shock protein E
LVAPLFAVLLFALGGCNVSGDSGGGAGSSRSHRAGPVSGGEARRLVTEEHATLLDVRTPGEFAEGHVDGAINVPLQALPAGAASVDRDRPVVVYCQSGGRSAQARSILSAEGYTVHDMGPMSAWGG